MTNDHPMNYEEIRDLIANAKKRTPVTVYVRHDGALEGNASDELMVFPTGAGTPVLVGADCHIGAGAVLAGVLEPPSAAPVALEDNVLVGANAVVLEGCRVGQGSVVAAGAVVTADVAPMVVVAGQPARVIKEVDEKTKDKTGLLKELRRLND